MVFNFEKPITWTYMPLYEKIAYYATKLDERVAPYIDKLEVKQIVTEQCSDLKVAKVVKIFESIDTISESDYNPNHLLKATHGCGMNLCLDGSLSIDTIIRSVEKQYTFVKPQFFIEEIIDDKYTGRSGKACVFMFRCIHGNPVSAGVRQGNGSNIQNTYSIDFTLIGKLNFELTKPTQWDAMLSIAKILSKPFEFVRIDFYIGSDENIYFSEYTFTPAGGNRVFSMEMEKSLGKLWH